MGSGTWHSALIKHLLRAERQSLDPLHKRTRHYASTSQCCCRTRAGIEKEATGRSNQQKELREACQQFLSQLEQAQGIGGAAASSTVVKALHPLQLACGSNAPKIMELALGCLHKLVAHAWLQGESLDGECASLP